MLEASSKATLRVVDREGCTHTRSMIAVRAPFRGHLWLRTGSDKTHLDKIGEGAEVSVTYGRDDAEPFVTIAGWAIVLRTARHAKCLTVADARRARASKRDFRTLVCVTARAAQMWDRTSASRPRVFAFSHAEPAFVEDSLDLLHDPRVRAGYTRAATLEHPW